MKNKAFYGKTAQDVYERLKFILGVNTAREIGKIAGITESGISSAIARNSIPYNFCAEVALTHNIPFDWLIFGDNDKKSNRSIEPDFFQRTYGETAFTRLKAKDRTTVLNDLGIEFINLYSTYTTFKNTDSFDDKNSILKIPFNQDWLANNELDSNNLICLQNKGDSMLPDYADGTIVLINQAVQYGDGVYAIRFNDSLRIKRLQWLIGNTIRISSDNPLYEPETIDTNTVKGQFEIIGQCHTKLSRIAQ